MSNTLLIYTQLRAAGVSRAGALGLLGNWKAESGLEPCRLQNEACSATGKPSPVLSPAACRMTSPQTASIPTPIPLM